MIRNLTYLESLEYLDSIDLGEKGAAFFECIHSMVKTKQLLW